MKKIICLTMAAALSIAPATINALAEQTNTGAYPKNFLQTLSFSSLNDFAIDGDSFFLADGSYLYTFDKKSESGQVLYGDISVYEHPCAIDKVEYSGDLLYFKSADGMTYSFASEIEECQFDFDATTTISANGYIYNLVGSQLGVFDLSTNSGQTLTGEFKSLKMVGDTVYTVMDGQVTTLEQATATPLSFTYTDYSSTTKIEVGDCFEKINQNYALSFVSLTANANLTEVRLNETNGTYFSVASTTTPATGTVALLIYKTDALAIVGIGDKSYITHPDYLTPFAYTPIENDLAQGYTLADVKMYSSPFINTATEIASIEKGALVTVKDKFSQGCLFKDFYLVEYSDGQTTVSGYVPAPTLSIYSYEGENNKENLIGDKENYATNLENVILVLILVALIIITIAYLTIVGTRPSKKQKEKEKQNVQPE